jgi:hypothetical protein
MPKNSSPQNSRCDPVPALVESRFRVLRESILANPNNDCDCSERHVDEARRRARNLDQKIIHTVATSTSGLLAQLRLLSEFYHHSANGMGRRGMLLIQTIATGIERLDAH